MKNVQTSLKRGTLRRRLLSLVPCPLLALSCLSAQAGTGLIEGRVSDPHTNLRLGGVRVSVVGTQLETYTNQSGEYLLAGVPSGTNSVEFSYVGYPDIIRTVQVEDSLRKTLSVDYNTETVQMEKFVITGSLVGMARALNQQRSAATLTNIVASDAIGQFPDENAAESLQRVPGLALYRDQGEGRYIIIRGVNAQYNHVAMDGASLATPETGLRTTPLDVIGSDSLGAIEVFKVNTPDMDADGLGGSVNLRSRSAFDSNERQVMINAETLYSGLRDGYRGSKFNGTFADLFANGKLGALFSVSLQRRPYGSNNFEESGGWSSVTSPSDGQKHTLFNGIGFREYEIVRTRQSANLNLDYHLTPETTVYLRTSYADFTDRENRWSTIFPFSKGTVTALSDTSATLTGISAISKNLRTREKEQKLFTSALGFESKSGTLDLDGQLSASHGQEWKPNELEGVFTTKASSSLRYSFENPYRVNVSYVSGIDPGSAASYVTQKSTLKNSWGDESELGARLNARYSLDLAAQPSYLKFGTSVRSKQKSLNKDSASITAGPTGFTFAALSEDASKSTYPYITGPRLSASALRSQYFDNPASFTLVSKESILADFKSHEDIFAAYAMAGTTLGKLDLSAGTRAENTRFRTDGTQLRGGVYTPQSAHSNYTNWQPGAYLRYDVTKQLVLRSSLSNTLSRPDFTQTAISRNVNDDAASKSVSMGNPNLKPLKSTNWDASAEYYFASMGMISAAAFYKDIRDFTYKTTTGTDEETGYPLNTYVNGPKGHIAGLELAYQQQLRFLPTPLDGLGFLANATFSDSEAEFPSRPGEKLPLIGESKTIGNVALTYEKSGFFIRLAANYRTPRLREDEALGASAAEDRHVDRFLQWDLTTSYKLSKHWQVYAELINLTNEPFRVYFGNAEAKRLVQFEEYDFSANCGVRWQL